MLKRILTFVTIVAIATICCVGTSSQNIDQLQASAENGDADAMAELGECYYFGKGVSGDRDKAFMWLSKAADAGSSKACFWLGACYENGYGTDMDLEKAVYWYGKSAESGYTDAMNTLAVRLKNGTGTARDLEKAAYWYRKAAELGNVYAMVNLANCYDVGIGVAVDKEEAYKWYGKAIDSGNDNESVRQRYMALKKEKEALKVAQDFAGSTWTMKNGDRTVAVYTFNKDHTYTAKYTNYLHNASGCYWTFTETGTWKLSKDLVIPTPESFTRPTVKVSPMANWQQKKYPSVMAAMTPGEYTRFLKEDISASEGQAFKLISDSKMDVKNARLTSDYDTTWGYLIKKTAPAKTQTSGKKSATKKRSGSRRR